MRVRVCKSATMSFLTLPLHFTAKISIFQIYSITMQDLKQQQPKASMQPSLINC